MSLTRLDRVREAEFGMKVHKLTVWLNSFAILQRRVTSPEWNRDTSVVCKDMLSNSNSKTVNLKKRVTLISPRFGHHDRITRSVIVVAAK
jgi:hypothetical protein